MVASLADVEDGIERGGLPGGGEHAAHAALEGVDLGGHGIVGGVGQSGVEVALVLEVEEACHLLAGVILEGGTLVDGQLLRLSLGGVPPTVNAKGFEVLFHLKM